MVRYVDATTILIINTFIFLNSIPDASSFAPNQSPSTWVLPYIPPSPILRITEKRSASVAASYYDYEDGRANNPKGMAYLDTLGKGDVLKRRERKVLLSEQSVTGGGKTTIYDVTLSIAKTAPSAAVAKTMGLQLRQISDQGEISDTSLDLDSMRYLSVAEEVYRDMNVVTPDNVEEDGPVGSVQLLNLPVNFVLDPEMKGIIVSRVIRGSLSWNAGVRSGDFMLATSATLGDKIWPKSTLDGVRSALSSRRIMSSKMKFQFKRAGFSIISSDEIVKEFEISLMRPLGLNIADKKDGYVHVTGFTEQASMLVRERLMIGDRVVAVESSIGGNMWPVSNVNGAVSACTSRLPGQPVKIRFERVVKEVGEMDNQTDDLTVNGASSVYVVDSSIERSQSKTNEKLLVRCCDVLKRYIAVYDSKSSRHASVPALVADRVLETLADGSATLDPKTLSLVMNSYLLCSQPDKAIRAFEAAVGMSADGSKRKTDVVILGKKEGSRIIADITAIDLFTGTDLIRAHSQIGDFLSARRVLAAMEGNDVAVDGVGNPKWPGKIKVDTQSYNSVLAAAAANAEGDLGLSVAIDVFNSMSEPLLFTTATPKKDLISYNIMIEAYARAGRRSDAFAIYNSMRDAGVNPDKVSITSLIKAVVKDDDIETARLFLRDMKNNNIEADVVAYNTVIRALCDKLQWYDAKELVAEMETSGINPDQKTYGLLMNGLMKANKPGACLTLFEAACADQRTVAMTENVQLYTTAVTAAATLGDYERALDLVSRMTFAGVKPNMKTLTALMGACLSGGRPDFAVDVFKKIKRPDGIALTRAVKAYCENKDFIPALDIIESQSDRERCIMTGKQVMSNYDYVMRCALESHNYIAAQKIMTNLLDNGFIPSKKIFKTIVTSLDLTQKITNEKTAGQSISTNNENGQFIYLLSVFDSIARRRLPCDASFYSAFLLEGARQGGLERKICSLITQARIDTTQFGNEICLDDDTDSDDACTVKPEITWSELFKNYSLYKEELDEISLPPIKPRVSPREIRLVSLAEQGVTFGARRNRASPRK